MYDNIKLDKYDANTDRHSSLSANKATAKIAIPKNCISKNLHKNEGATYNGHDVLNINWHIIEFYLRSSIETENLIEQHKENLYSTKEN